MITGLITVFDDRIVVHKRDHHLHNEWSTTYPAATEANLYDAARVLASWLRLREGEPVARSSEQTQADDAADAPPINMIDWLERDDIVTGRDCEGTYFVRHADNHWEGCGKSMAEAIRVAILAEHKWKKEAAKLRKPPELLALFWSEQRWHIRTWGNRDTVKAHARDGDTIVWCVPHDPSLPIESETAKKDS